MLIYLIRHGQSFNTHHSLDEPHPVNPPLTPIGQREAGLVGKRLALLQPQRLFVSPMLRTIETARLITKSVALRIEVRAKIFEFRATRGYFCVGAKGLRERFPDLVLPSDLHEGEWEYGNEPLESAAARADELLLWLAELARSDNPPDRVAVVSHGAFIRTTVGRILGARPDQMWRVLIDNTSLTTLEYLEPTISESTESQGERALDKVADGQAGDTALLHTGDGFTLLGLNDTTHLACSGSQEPGGRDDDCLDPQRGISR